MTHSGPIGVFDSGVGGVSIWQEIHALLPGESTVYLADSHHAPYGGRPQSEIIALSRKNTDLLLEMGAKAIVVACNTATTNAVAHLRAHYHVPFVGIEPAIKPAALQSQTKAVGILATKGTLSSQLFHQTSSLYSQGIEVVEQVGEGLVPLIEADRVDSPEMRELLQRYLEPMLAAHIDHLVLGCTHYPFLIPVLRELLPPGVTIVDSGPAVARQTRAILLEHGLRAPGDLRPTHRFFTNADLGILRKFVGLEGPGFEFAALDF